MAGSRRLVSLAPPALLAVWLCAACASQPAAPIHNAATASAASASRVDPAGDLIAERAPSPAPAPEGDVAAAPAPAPEPAPEADIQAEPLAPAEAPEPEPAAPEAAPETVHRPAPVYGRETGTLAGYLHGLREASCPAGTKFEAPETIGLEARPVPVSPLNPGKKTVGDLTFVAGFHLTSPEKRFGGLSDLHFLPDGNLLAVSDEGHFVWIDLGADGVTPTAARISDLRDAHGHKLNNKTEADSEGLAINGGMVLVSFERDHRVLAYDLGDCGAAARGAPIVYDGYGLPMPEAFRVAHIKVPDNTSLEALAVTPDWYMFSGLEQEVDESGPLSARPVEAPPNFDLRVEKGAPAFVALDLVPEGGEGDVRAFTLHRGFSPLAGNAITISETDFRRRLDTPAAPSSRPSELQERARWRYEAVKTRRLAEMNIMLTIDNFEGLAAKQLPDGSVRLFVVSDDNYSGSQRTLLMVYDLPKGG
ncbi:MAG: hypothetical protein GC155_16985 [Alphaproteobacteria bacterium]|nr:hypothetical protein [Alphaproteobacteria bacterium]